MPEYLTPLCNIKCELHYQTRGLSRKITIQGNTMLGVKDKETTKHFAPQELDNRPWISLDDVPDAKHISRRHAIVCAPDRRSNVYQIVDANSLYGTKVNGEQIPFCKLQALYPGDTLELAQSVFTVAYEPLRTEGRGVIIGYHGGDLRGVEQDVKKLHAELCHRGFSLVQLLNGTATKRAVLDEVQNELHKMRDNQIFLMHYAGHGSNAGLHLNPCEADFVLSPEDLFNVFAPYRSRQKLLIFDGCYTSAFADRLPANTLLIGTEGEAHEKHFDPSMTAHVFGATKYMGRTTRAIYKELQATDNPINVTALAHRVSGLEDIASKQRVGCYGNCDFSLPMRG